MKTTIPHSGPDHSLDQHEIKTDEQRVATGFIRTTSTSRKTPTRPRLQHEARPGLQPGFVPFENGRRPGY